MYKRGLYLITLLLFLVLMLLVSLDTTIEAKPIETIVEVKPIPIKSTPLVIELKTVEREPELTSLGEFTLTGYCGCSECCGVWANNRPEGKVVGAVGKELTANHSIAVDPNVIPYGTLVVINGQTYEAMDCGGAIKGNDIDIYFNSHEEAVEFGVQYAEVFLHED